MGSDSDWPLVQKAAEALTSFGVAFEVRVISAHRTPDLAFEYAAGAEARGLKVLIAAAGGAAHLGGVLAAHTVLPVIGIPVTSIRGLNPACGKTSTSTPARRELSRSCCVERYV